MWELYEIARVDFGMSEDEFFSYTLAEFNALCDRQNEQRRRVHDVPAALICSIVANYAGKTLADNEYMEMEDFILRTPEQARQYEFEKQDVKIRAGLEAFAARYANINGEE